MERISKLDPNTCSIEELEAEVVRLKDMTEYYESKQLAVKRFINSVYGACASKYFVAHNIDVAEAITLQGQSLNHYSENSMNEYFSGIFQHDTELHKKLGIDSKKALNVDLHKGKITDNGPLTGPEFSFLKGTESGVVCGDTDSVEGKSVIEINGEKGTIEEYWKKFSNAVPQLIHSSDGQEIIPLKSLSLVSKALNVQTKNVHYDRVDYIMRHKVSKERYKITSESGKSVIVTGDHSVMVERDGEIVSVKAKEMKKTDKLVSLKK